MSWFKQAQVNEAGAILLAMLVDSGNNPAKPMEDVTSRFYGQSPDVMQQALTYSMGELNRLQGGGLKDSQQNIVQQVQNMISGNPQDQNQMQNQETQGLQNDSGIDPGTGTQLANVQ